MSTSEHALQPMPMAHVPRSILEEGRQRPPVQGKVRTGTKVLTSAAAKIPQAVQIYQDGLFAQRSFDAIEKDIRAKCGFDKSPLAPRNIPHFRVSGSDFANPSSADKIMELYAEDRGNGLGRQLYRFPVLLPFDDILEAFPHSMEAYRASGRVHWSEYDAIGVRRCMRYRPVKADPRARRALRTFGGRVPEINTSFSEDGACRPELCPLYQNRECGLKASLLFWIPGLAGSSLISVNTSSIYSMKQIVASMHLVAATRGGKLMGMLKGRPIFYLTKVGQEVVQLDEAGNPKRVKQWLVHLESDVDMMEIIAAHEARTSIKAVGHIVTPPVVVDEAPALAAPPAATGGSATGNESPPKAKHSPEVAALRRKLFDLLLALEIPQESFMRRAAEDWGEGWGANLDSLQAAIDVLPTGPETRPAFALWLNKAPF